MAVERSLANCFMTWFGTASPAIRAEVKPEKRQGRVTMRFPRFRTLRGDIRRNCLSIAAMDGHDIVHDWLMDLDSLPIRDEAGFVYCGLREGERQTFAHKEALWRDHLFDPFGQWVADKLMTAKALDYYDFDGMLVARLRHDDRDGPEHDRFYRRYVPRAAGTAEGNE